MPSKDGKSEIGMNVEIVNSSMKIFSNVRKKERIFRQQKTTTHQLKDKFASPKK